MNDKNYAEIRTVLIILMIIIIVMCPLFAEPIMVKIRSGFNTVGAQSPVQNYLGDTVFFLVVSIFLIPAWVLAKILPRFDIPKWCGFFPVLFIIALWIYPDLSLKSSYMSSALWMTYIGYSATSIGLWLSIRREGGMWYLIWIPPMIFLATRCIAGWSFDVYFE